jgi:hypothetical protein
VGGLSTDDGELDFSSILFGYPGAERCLPLLLQGVVSVLYFSDSLVLRRGIVICKSLLLRCFHFRALGCNPALLTTVGNDAYHALLMLLYNEVHWVSGMEPEVIEYLMETYCSLVLALDAEFPSGGTAGPISPRVPKLGVEQPGCISTHPRQVILC